MIAHHIDCSTNSVGLEARSLTCAALYGRTVEPARGVLDRARVLVVPAERLLIFWFRPKRESNPDQIADALIMVLAFVADAHSHAESRGRFQKCVLPFLARLAFLSVGGCSVFPRGSETWSSSRSSCSRSSCTASRSPAALGFGALLLAQHRPLLADCFDCA